MSDDTSIGQVDHTQADDISRLPSGVNLYLAMWDCNGLEFIFNVSEWDRAKVWADVAGTPPPPPPPPLQTLLLRARYNMQRHYEIYTFTAGSSLSTEDMKEAFDSTPQAMVDLIRSRGNCLHSDRVTEPPLIV